MQDRQDKKYMALALLKEGFYPVYPANPVII